VKVPTIFFPAMFSQFLVFEETYGKSKFFFDKETFGVDDLKSDQTDEIIESFVILLRSINKFISQIVGLCV